MSWRRRRPRRLQHEGLYPGFPIWTDCRPHNGVHGGQPGADPAPGSSQLALLPPGQPRRSARGRLGPQAPRPVALIRLPPPPHRTPRRLHLPRDGGHRPARLQELHGPSPALLQLCRRARGSHRPSRPPRSLQSFHYFCNAQSFPSPKTLLRNFCVDQGAPDGYERDPERQSFHYF